MDADALILMGMLIAAIAWWFKLQLDDTRKLALELRREELDREKRAERVRQLLNRR